MDEEREYDTYYLDDLYIGKNVVLNNTRARMSKSTTEQIIKCFVNLIGLNWRVPFVPSCVVYNAY